jgi:hypothetical protein|tara:strand:- start:208 stop:318 length:111 start_codon:yes stop_codon:yes gene_type:complete
MKCLGESETKVDLFDATSDAFSVELNSKTQCGQRIE